MSKKILIINNGLGSGGIERASTSLSNYFDSKGYTVMVLALYQDNKIFKLNSNIKFCEPNFDRSKLSKIRYILKLIPFIRKETLNFNPDTILAFSEWTNPYVVISLVGLNIPIFLSDRMNPLAKLPMVTLILKKLTYRRVSGIIAQTNFAKRIISNKTGAQNIHVIFNPVNRICVELGVEKNIIISVGRLSKEKGHRFLIQAFSKLSDANWRLSIVGDGEERDNLKILADKLGVYDKVVFHGHLSDFSKQLSEAKIFVLPSLKEGFPNALIEAMATSKACISSDFFDGENEIISDGINGLLFKPGDVDGLYIAIRKLVLDESLRRRIAQQAKLIGNELEFEKIADKYLKTIFNGNN